MRRPGRAWGGAVCTFKRMARTGTLIRWCLSKDLKKDLQSVGFTDDRM